MKIRTRIWLITAACLLLLGLILFFVTMSTLDWDFSKLSTTEFETNNYELTGDFNSIAIETDTADIIFAITDNGRAKVVCYEPANVKHTVSVENDVLRVNVIDERKWYEFIGITVYTPKITIYLSKNQYADLTIREDTGDVKIPDTFQFVNMDIRTSTGDVKNYASALDKMKMKTNTGDIHIEGVTADALDLCVSTGCVNLRNVTCKNLTSTGDTGILSWKT